MDQPVVPRPKIAETVIAPPVRFREARIGSCEILGDTAIEYSELGDFSYLGGGCMVADARIVRFCAIAAQIRIGAPNHPIDRPSLHRFTYRPEYYSDTAQRDQSFFAQRRADRVVIGHEVWIGHATTVLPGVRVGAARCWPQAPWSAATWNLTASWARAGAADQAAFQPRDRRGAGADRMVGLARRNDFQAAG